MRRGRGHAVAAALLALVVGGCTSAPTGSDPAISFGSEFGPATWALDPAFASPAPDATELHILVWERACSSGSAATGRMSAPLVAFTDSALTITVGVRPMGGIQSCPSNQATPLVVRLAEPLGERTLLDGGRDPIAPPSPPY